MPTARVPSTGSRQRLDVDGVLGWDRDRARRQVGKRGVDLYVALGPRPAQEVGDVDSQTGRNGHLATIVQGPQRRTAGREGVTEALTRARRGSADGGPPEAQW